MIEIIPNWHPIFVHFTVALLSLAVGLFVVTPFVRPSLQEQWKIVARWALWFGAGFAAITVLTGIYAFNTVAHDTPSHAAMTEHRNLALVTFTLFLSLTVWSVVLARRQQALGTLFVVAMVVAGGMLASTAWHGGEVVYRYGLGVFSLPKVEREGHTHEHGDGGHSHAEHDETISDMHQSDNHPSHDGDHDAMDAQDTATMLSHDDDSNSANEQHDDDGHDHKH